MNDSLLESLLNEGESTSLDFKRDQYPFEGATDNEKSELLKDVLAFANAWRRTDAFILIGVEEVSGGKSRVIGVSTHLSDASVQQFVNKKVQRPLVLSYEPFLYCGTGIGVIHIPLQERPFYLKKQYGKLAENTVYLRRGSSTDIASPDEVAKMGRARQEELNTRIELRALLEELKVFLDVSLKVNYQEGRVVFVCDQYQRLFEKGVIVRLDENLRSLLRIAYSEIKMLDRIIRDAWSSGRGSNTWAMAVNEAAGQRTGAAAKVLHAYNQLSDYLNEFGG